MITRSHANRDQKTEPTTPFGFINIFCGGTGRGGLDHFARFCDRDGSAFSVANLQIDTDDNALNDSPADFKIRLTMTRDHVKMVSGNAEKFGPQVRQVLTKQKHLLRNVSNGMRTTRSLTVIPYAIGRQEIITGFRNAITALTHQGATTFIPVLISSTGGGTGSATSVLLFNDLSNPRFVSDITEGYTPGCIEDSIIFAVDPWANIRS